MGCILKGCVFRCPLEWIRVEKDSISFLVISVWVFRSENASCGSEQFKKCRYASSAVHFLVKLHFFFAYENFSRGNSSVHEHIFSSINFSHFAKIWNQIERKFEPRTHARVGSPTWKWCDPKPQHYEVWWAVYFLTSRCPSFRQCSHYCCVDRQ